jgi:hypothetical protein
MTSQFERESEHTSRQRGVRLELMKGGSTIIGGRDGKIGFTGKESVAAGAAGARRISDALGGRRRRWGLWANKWR